MRLIYAWLFLVYRGIYQKSLDAMAEHLLFLNTPATNKLYQKIVKFSHSYPLILTNFVVFSGFNDLHQCNGGNGTPVNLDIHNFRHIDSICPSNISADVCTPAPCCYILPPLPLVHRDLLRHQHEFPQQRPKRSEQQLSGSRLP